MIRSNVVKEKWPTHLVDYLESKITFQTILQPNKSLSEFDFDVVGSPQRILRASDVCEEIVYVCEWNYGQRKIVASSTAKQEFPLLVIDFLERNLQ